LQNAWLREKPTERQAAFLFLDCPEAMYGGSAGGGKSSALLMAALQFVDVPGYAALLLRRSFSDLSLPGALMARAAEWLGGTKARWDGQKKTWFFPSGASLSFGYLDNENDKYRYQSSEFQHVGFDELTQFYEEDYRYLFSRLRRLKSSRVPVRMRSASNPGGIGHDWVKQRFLVEGQAEGRVFVSARLDDNPHLDREQYVSSLSQLDPITRAQLLAGDWSARRGGGIFRREWFRIEDTQPSGLRLVRAWDMAASEAKAGSDPDWTCGCLMGRSADGMFWVLDVRRIRGTPQAVEQLVRRTAEEDGPAVTVCLEQEPGSAGVALVQRYYALLAGWPVVVQKPTGDKVTRAAPFSSQAEGGMVACLRGRWLTDFLDELEGFPGASSHDDQVDAASWAFVELAKYRTCGRITAIRGDRPMARVPMYRAVGGGAESLFLDAPDFRPSQGPIDVSGQGSRPPPGTKPVELNHALPGQPTPPTPSLPKVRLVQRPRGDWRSAWGVR
jgi:predicted phage terminase large subunit-like protein